MKVIHHVLGVVAGLAMIMVILITSFEIGIYSDFDWYQKEYEKYEVLDDLEMEIEDVMVVTYEMMDYLRGDREDLVVNTIVNGSEREFFNDREKAHMIDVKNLFLGGLDLRLHSLVIVTVCVIIIVFSKGDWKKILPKTFLITLGTFVGAVGIFGILCATDFTKYFTLFHEIFFDNDLWILNPKTDLLIRMLPEGFFFDMVVRIGTILVIMLVIAIVISVATLRRQKDKKNL